MCIRDRDPFVSVVFFRSDQEGSKLKIRLGTLSDGKDDNNNKWDGTFFSEVCSVRYRYSRYRYGCRTEVTEMSGTGIDVAPNLPKCPVPVLMLYRTYRSVRYRYESLYPYRRYRYPCRTELTDVSGAGIDVSNLPKWYLGHTELTEVSGCLLYTSPSPRDQRGSRMPSSA